MTTATDIVKQLQEALEKIASKRIIYNGVVCKDLSADIATDALALIPALLDALQVSGDGIERCIQVCRDLSREYSGNPDDKTLDEIIVDAKEAIAALQTPKEQPVKDNAYYRRVYNECSEGEFHPFRDHETNFGWGICHRKTKRIFGYIGEKSKCFGVSAALNGKWEAAKEFLEGDIPDEYFEQFKLLGD